MSLDFSLYEVRPTEIFSCNITHNLNTMAEEAGIYNCLWRPDENGFTKAKDIIPILRDGLAKMVNNPEHFKKFDSPNGWGTYEHFVPWIREVLKGCEDNPEADIVVSR